MRHIITEYLSKNGIYFHHSRSTYEKGEVDQMPPQTHNQCEVFLLLSGAITYRVEGQSYHLSPMNAIVITPNKLHSLEVDTSQSYERIVLQFAPNLLPSFADLYLLSHYGTPSTPTFVIPQREVKKSKLLQLMQNCETLSQSNNKYLDLRFVGIILQLIETLNEMLTDMNASNTLPPINADEISYHCVQYVHQNLTKKALLTPKYLAKQLHISASHLQHTFKKEMGVTLHAYVFNQRMQLAHKLLLQGNSPQAVANLLEYEYYSTFYHGFVKRFGAPPNAFVGVQQEHWRNTDV